MLAFSDMFIAGLLPHFLSEADPRDAVTQLDEQYGHGGGWSDFIGFTLEYASPDDVESYRLVYPDDSPCKAVSWAKLHDKERIVLFDYAWVAVVQPDMSMRVARMD